jgi:hypothetical protein
MRQEINFYRKPQRRSWREFTPATLALALAGLALALAGVSLVKLQANRHLREQDATLRQQVGGMEAQLAQLQAQFPEAKPDPGLIAEAERRRRQVEQLRTLLDAAVGEQPQQRHGFSPYFEGLARHPMADLWLREVRLRRGGRDIELAGSALASDSIPKLVEALGTEEAFKATLFSDLIVRRPEQQTGQVNFTLRTWIPRQEQTHGQP